MSNAKPFGISVSSRRNTKSENRYDTKKTNRVKKTLKHDPDGDDSSGEDFRSSSMMCIAHMKAKSNLTLFMYLPFRGIGE